MKVGTKTWNRVAPLTKQFVMNQGGSIPGANGGWAGSFGQVGGEEWSDSDARNLRSTIPWVAAACDNRRDDVVNAEFIIGPKDKDAWSPADQTLADSLMALLRSPDPAGENTSWASMMGPVVEDAAIVRKGAVMLIRGDLEHPYDPGSVTNPDNVPPINRMRALDGSRIRINPKWDLDAGWDGWHATDDIGRLLMPRYYYMDQDPESGQISSNKGKGLANEELMLIQPTNVSYDRDGLGPMMYIQEFVKSHRDTFNSIWQVQKNRQPSGILNVPTSNPTTIDKLVSMWRERLEGKGGIGIVNIGSDANFIPMGDINLANQGAFAFVDIIVRGIAAGWRTSTVRLGWTMTTLERTASQQEAMDDQGTVNTLKLIADYFQREFVQSFQGSENLVFAFTQLPDENEAEGADVISQWTGASFMVPSPDDLRIKAGLDVIERDKDSLLDRAYKDMWVKTAGTFVPVFMTLGLAPNALSPGYDPDKGEIDEKAAQEHAQQAMQMQQQAMTPPGGAQMNGNAPSNDNTPPNGSTNGQNGAATPSNGNGNGNGPAALSALKPVAVGKAAQSAADREIADAEARQLDELDALFRANLKKARGE